MQLGKLEYLCDFPVSKEKCQLMTNLALFLFSRPESIRMFKSSLNLLVRSTRDNYRSRGTVWSYLVQFVAVGRLVFSTIILVRTALPLWKFLTKKRITSVPHPHYSPDLAPYDFFVSRMKIDMKGKSIIGVDEIKGKTTKTLWGTTDDNFKNVLSDGIKDWTTVKYFEAMNIFCLNIKLISHKKKFGLFWVTSRIEL